MRPSVREPAPPWCRPYGQRVGLVYSHLAVPRPITTWRVQPPVDDSGTDRDVDLRPTGGSCRRTGGCSRCPTSHRLRSWSSGGSPRGWPGADPSAGVLGRLADGRALVLDRERALAGVPGPRRAGRDRAGHRVASDRHGGAEVVEAAALRAVEHLVLRVPSRHLDDLGVEHVVGCRPGPPDPGHGQVAVRPSCGRNRGRAARVDAVLSTGGGHVAAAEGLELDLDRLVRQERAAADGADGERVGCRVAGDHGPERLRRGCLSRGGGRRYRRGGERAGE